MNLSDYVLDFLIKKRVKKVFLITGGAISFLVDAFSRNNKIKYIIRNNQNIHCYGASTKGNVLLQYFNIDNKKISFAAERNQNKYGLVTPGSKIKIISEENSRKMKPDYYLVLPWHFKKEILKTPFKGNT